MQVAGLSQLARLSAQQPTAAQLLFSSVSSIVAPLGQPNYAAANAILNAHANSQTLQVQPSLISHCCTSRQMLSSTLERISLRYRRP